jgi:methylmalonyl-CoA/ethylmalonyl-CoA epimerase
MFKKINHIGIVVKSLEKAIPIYSKGLGIAPEKITEIKDVQLKVAVLRIGEVEIELLEYGNPDLPIARALRGNQPGINHICYEVEQFDKTMANLVAQGFKLVEGFPRKGVHGKIAFFIPPHSPAERMEILEVEGKHE